jgi:hypothetical protein
MLATAICLKRYMKHNMSPALCNPIEKEWLDRWKEQLRNPTQTPRQVLRAYVEELDITVAGLNNQVEMGLLGQGRRQQPPAGMTRVRFKLMRWFEPYSSRHPLQS